jgi:LysM repeat protein
MRRSWRYATALGLALAAWTAFSSPAHADYPRHHQVVNGDTLWSIADAYDVTVDELVRRNEIQFPDLILPGDVIEIPPAAEAEAPVSTIEYEVQPGDTLSHIAVRFDTWVEDLRSINQLNETQFIVPGQRLKVPAAAPPHGDEEQATRHPPEDPELEQMFNELAASEGVDPGLVKAIAWLESGWQQHVVSPAGAVGFMQLTPVTVQWLEQAVFGYQLNEDASVHDNVNMGVTYLRILMEATGDEDKAIASYYQGYGATMSGVMYEETKHYVQLVRAVQERYWPG